MNEEDQNLNQNPVNAESNSAQASMPATPPVKISLKEKLKEEFFKFKQNKKLFYPLVGAVGLLVTLIIVGSIYSIVKNYSKTSRVQEENTPTDTKVVITSEEGLDEKMIIVQSLESQISNLDLKQRKLSSPNINFNLGFGATP